MVALGEKTVPAGIAAILIALLPVWVAVLGRIFFGERLPLAVVVGIVVGLAGRGHPRRPVRVRAARLAFDPFGILVPAHVADVLGRRVALLVPPGDPAAPTADRDRSPDDLRRGLLLRLGSIVIGELATFDVAAVSTRSWLGLVYLTTIGSLVGFTTYVWLLRVAPLPKIATYAYVNPVVAFILAGILLGEAIEPRTVLAGAVIIFAVALIVTARSRTTGRPARARSRAVEARADRGRPGRSPPADASAQPSARTVRLTRRARAITVSIGFTPSAVGKSDVSAT